MKATVELWKDFYVPIEMGDPVCGRDICDCCGDCLTCYNEGCMVDGEWKEEGECFWVIYEGSWEDDEELTKTIRKGLKEKRNSYE